MIFKLRWKLKTLPCWLFGQHELVVDTKMLLGTCHRCRWLFEVIRNPLASGPYFLPRAKIDCGEYNCCVDDVYGFVPEAGCPEHD